MQPGDRVRLITNPSRVGVLTNDAPIGEGRREKRRVLFPDGEETVLLGSLERVLLEVRDPSLLMQRGQYAGVKDLRGAITFHRLTGKLANLIYSLNTTNTRFLPYQFKPVLQYLDSPSRGLVIADEVGLGKTIEAGLIWTELRARQDARRLLVVCPAMLTDKWCRELEHRFGVQAKAVNANQLLDELRQAKADRYREFALVISMQGSRPPRGWDDDKAPSKSAAAELARFLQEQAIGPDEPLLDMVVVDEAHYLRNSHTLAHKFAKLLRPNCDGMVLLSATPIQMRSTDLFNLLHLLDQDAFPHEWTYDLSVRANAPLVALRDRLRRELVSAADFREALQQAISLRWYEGSQQVQHLMQNLPTDEVLASPAGRAEFAELVDKLNPRAKVVTRTLKRDVHELRVQRDPHVVKVQMRRAERDFYDAVTEAVRAYCEDMDVADSFLLTIPQRQMSSCMAAACQSWARGKGEAEDEADFLAELTEGQEDALEAPEGKAAPDARSGLMQTLHQVANVPGLAAELSQHDSKFDHLVDGLAAYWRAHPGKKVVLFAFYKGTLYHLAKKLAAKGVIAAILHGGLDKQSILKGFEDPDGPLVLLSSEVAAEGVDLQFSSLLINYDLPWNPAKLEQRIGRIDRIGQEAPKILIWNLVYADTLDDRVHTRLLERLNVFKAALGAMEDTLGQEVKKLTRNLLSHRLNAAEEVEQIEQTAMALEQQRRDQLELDEKASNLLGHGDFIQNKARAARDLGRFVRGEDLYFYVKDYLERTYPGSRVMVDDQLPRKGRVELSVIGRVEFDAFLREYRLLGKTSLLAEAPKIVCFDNQSGDTPRDLEKITQDHPLVRFISERQKAAGKGLAYFPTSAICVPAAGAVGVKPGVYVYVVRRWSFGGPRVVERLVYEVRDLDTGTPLDEDLAEAFVNNALLTGDDWFDAARNSLNHQRVAEMQDRCMEAIELRVASMAAMQTRANRDRIREMTSAIEKEVERRTKQIEELLARLRAANEGRNKGLIKINESKLEKLKQKFEEKLVVLQRQEAEGDPGADVSSGVINVQ